MLRIFSTHTLKIACTTVLVLMIIGAYIQALTPHHSSRDNEVSLNEPTMLEEKTLLQRSGLVGGTGDWSYETINNGPGTGYDISMDMGSDGRIHIIYHDDENDRIKYTEFDDGEWTTWTFDECTIKNYGSSIALDSNDDPAMTVCADRKLVLIQAQGGQATNTTLDENFQAGSNIGPYSSIDFDSNDNIHISYQDASLDVYDLKYATNRDGAFSFYTVDSEGTNGKFTSIAVDSQNIPHISYQRTDQSELKYAKEDGGWALEIVDGVATNTGWHTSLALDSQNNPHIAYYDSTENSLKYAYWSGSQWTIDVVNQESNQGSYPCLLVDENNKVHISYYSQGPYDNNGKLVYGTYEGSSWDLTRLHNTSGMGKYPSLALDDLGKPVIAYTDSAQNQLRLVRWDQEAPVAQAGADVVKGQNEEVSFDASASIDNCKIEDYRWKFEENGINRQLSGRITDYSFGEVGTYTVELNVTDCAGNWDTDTFLVTIEDTQAPQADAGGPYVGDQHHPVVFSGEDSYDNVEIQSYVWTFVYRDNNKELTGVTAQFTFEDIGHYNIILNVTDSAGYWDTQNASITIYDSTTPNAHFSVDTDDHVIDQGTRLAMDGSMSTDNVEIMSYRWTIYFNDVEIEAFEESMMTYKFMEVGEYLIKLNVTDGMGNWDVETLEITTRDAISPEAKGSVPSTVVQGDTAVFNGSNSTDNVAVTSYTWKFLYEGKPITLGGATCTFVFSTIGLYEITLKVTDLEGNSHETLFELTVTDGINPTAHIYSEGIGINATLYNFDARNSTDNVGIVNYTWSFKEKWDTKYFYLDFWSYNFTGTGKYNITLTVSDLAGNTHGDFVIIDINIPEKDDITDNTNDGTEERSENDRKNEEDGLNPVIWVVLIMVLAIVIGVGAIIIASQGQKKQGKEERSEDKEEMVAEKKFLTAEEEYAMLYGNRNMATHTENDRKELPVQNRPPPGSKKNTRKALPPPPRR